MQYLHELQTDLFPLSNQCTFALGMLSLEQLEQYHVWLFSIRSFATFGFKLTESGGT
jgi:hypothetical protein